MRLPTISPELTLRMERVWANERAARAGCDLLFGQCAFGSISHHNQESCGLRTAYTKAVWTVRP